MKGKGSTIMRILYEENYAELENTFASNLIWKIHLHHMINLLNLLTRTFASYELILVAPWMLIVHSYDADVLVKSTDAKDRKVQRLIIHLWIRYKFLIHYFLI